MKFHLNHKSLLVVLSVMLVMSLTSCRDTSKSEQVVPASSDVSTTQPVEVDSLTLALLPDAPSAPILDMAELFSPKDISEIGEDIKELDSLQLAQVAVVTVKDFKGIAPLDYATALANKWGVGHKETNDGITIVIKPKTGERNEERGEVAFATGLGMQKIITDDMCKRINDEVMVPKFKKNQYGEGVKDALNKIKDILTGDKD